MRVLGSLKALHLDSSANHTHPLTSLKLTAEQRAQLSKPRPFLLLLILGIFSLPWLFLFVNGVRARQQQRQMDSAAEQFFNHLPIYPRNASAIQFDQLAANLGFSPNDSSGPPIYLNQQAGQVHQRFDPLIKEFLRTQATKTSGPLDALPAELSDYLKAYTVPISAVQTHLLEQPVPQWDMTIERMFDPDYPFPGFFNVRSLQELLLLSALEHNTQGQHADMVAVLEASWRLNQALLKRPDLTAQVSVSAVSEQQAGLFRHLNNLPEQWVARLGEQAQHQSVISAHQFETWLLYKIQQQSLASATYQAKAKASLGDQLASTMFYWFSPAYFSQRSNIDTIQTTHRALERLPNLDVCSTAQTDVAQLLAQEKTAKWNQATALSPIILAKRWKVSGDRALNLELTQNVLQAKLIRKATGEWPKKLPNLSSAACPDTHWTYRHDSKTDTITISLSAQVAPTIYSEGLYPGPPIPFYYQSDREYSAQKRPHSSKSAADRTPKK